MPIIMGNILANLGVWHVLWIRSHYQLVHCRARTVSPENIRMAGIAVLFAGSVMQDGRYQGS